MIGGIEVFGLFMFLGWYARRGLRWLHGQAAPRLGASYRVYVLLPLLWGWVVTRGKGPHA